jgi:CarboxypepD_reg-like domain
MMLMRFYLRNRIFAGLLCLFLATPFLGFTQQIVNGKVISKTDQSAIPAVTILIKGTKNGTTSDIDGIFSIKANKGDVPLVTGVGQKKT